MSDHIISHGTHTTKYRMLDQSNSQVMRTFFFKNFAQTIRRPSRAILRHCPFPGTGIIHTTVMTGNIVTVSNLVWTGNGGCISGQSGIQSDVRYSAVRLVPRCPRLVGLLALYRWCRKNSALVQMCMRRPTTPAPALLDTPRHCGESHRCQETSQALWRDAGTTHPAL